MKGLVTTVSTTIAIGLLAGGAITVRAQGESPSAPSLAWEACGDRFDCASVSVPWDHDHPGAGSFDIPLVRQPATGPGDRIGALLYNPGGPGIPGTSTLMALIDAFPKPVQERFDIVSFDPRGTGAAQHIDCGTDVSALFALDPTVADGPASTAWADMAAACAERLGEHLSDYSTTATARDIDLIREALGEDRISWFGTSYGTRLGAEYLRLFPDRVRAMVLDGAMDPSAPLSQQAADQAAAAEAALDRSLAACWGMVPCPLDGDLSAVFDALAAQLAGTPLTSSAGAAVGLLALEAAAQGSVALPLFFAEPFVSALGSAQAGDGEGLLALGPGSYTDGSGQSTFDAQWVILCNDEAERLDATGAAELAQRLSRAASRIGLGVASGWGIGCQGFPEAEAPLAPFESEAARPVLVIGSTGDPSTPYVWAERMADVLGARFLTREGGGHTAFFNTFMAGCSGDAVAEFLLDPEVAGTPSTCTD